MFKNDRWIIEQAQRGMISPFEPAQVRQVDNTPVISYGLSSFGYDMMLSDGEFYVFRHVPGTIVSPKSFTRRNLERVQLQHDEEGSYFVLPGNSYGLGFSREKFSMSPNVIGICIGKSTYARIGIIANITPLEPSWIGNLTIELSNASTADCKIFANEGIAQVLFAEGDLPDVNYATRQGKYQEQPAQVVLAKV